MADPLILTARFDAASAATLQRLRDRHFPPALNIVPAHCTLFHHLPGADRAAVEDLLRDACAAEGRMPFTAGSPRFLGRGVALTIEAPALVRLRARLAADWRDALTRQDRQGFRPHVTIQNKADPGVARALHAQLLAGFPALSGTIESLDLWHYRGGPWEAAGSFAFAP